MRAEIVPATREHVSQISELVRNADRTEMFAIACLTPAQVMLMGLEISDFARTGLIDGKPVCMFGVAPASLMGGVGRPWLVGTESLDDNAIIFLRRCRDGVKEMLSLYSTLENYVDARNRRAIAWLRWLKFTICEQEPMGPFNVPFHRFEMRR